MTEKNTELWALRHGSEEQGSASIMKDIWVQSKRLEGMWGRGVEVTEVWRAQVLA